MVAGGYVVLAGPWPDYITIPLAAGAVSFYLSDALLVAITCAEALAHAWQQDPFDASELRWESA